MSLSCRDLSDDDQKLFRKASESLLISMLVLSIFDFSEIRAETFSICSSGPRGLRMELSKDLPHEVEVEIDDEDCWIDIEILGRKRRLVTASRSHENPPIIR